MKYLRWLFWSCYYALFCRRVGTLEEFVRKLDRTLPPWRQGPFVPSIFRNEDGALYEIWLSDESCFVVRRKLALDVAIGQESGRIVGLFLYDEQLVGQGKQQRESRGAHA